MFLCLDEALSGKGERAVRMLKKFEQEAVAPISILVNLTREIELCKNTALAVQAGQPAMQALSKTYLWDSKKTFDCRCSQSIASERLAKINGSLRLFRPYG